MSQLSTYPPTSYLYRCSQVLVCVLTDIVTTYRTCHVCPANTSIYNSALITVLFRGRVNWQQGIYTCTNILHYIVSASILATYICHWCKFIIIEPSPVYKCIMFLPIMCFGHGPLKTTGRQPILKFSPSQCASKHTPYWNLNQVQ